MDEVRENFKKTTVRQDAKMSPGEAHKTQVSNINQTDGVNLAK